MTPYEEYLERNRELKRRLEEEQGLLASEIPTREAELQNTLSAAIEPRSYNRNDALATGIASIVPMVLGAALAGKRGAAFGGKAGETAGTSYAKLAKERLEAEDQGEKDKYLADARDLTKKKDRDEQLKDNITKLGLEEAEKGLTQSNFERQMTRLENDDASDRQREEGDNSLITPEMVADIAARTGRDIDTVLAELRLPKSQFYKLNQYKYAEGANLKLPDASVDDKLAAGKNFNDVITKMDRLSDEMYSDPGVVEAIKAGKLTSLYKDPKSPAYRYFAQAELAKKMIARMNDSGALSKIDVEMFDPLVVGSPIYDTKDSVKQRIADLRQLGNEKISNMVQGLEATGRNVTKAKKMFGKEIAGAKTGAGGLSPEEEAELAALEAKYPGR